MDDSSNTNADYEILMLDEQNATFVEDESIRDPVTMLSILIVGTFLSLLIFFSIAGNILVCVAIYTDRGLRRIGNLFLASLAIADLFVASLVMTFAGVNDLLGYWIFGAQFCDTWVAFDVMCSTASILNLCAISLDRYIHIKDPLRYGRWVTRRVAVATIATIWLLAALISFVPISLGLHRPPQPLVYHDEHGQHYPTCALDLTPSYAVISSCISFYVPCIVMIGIYCRLYCYAQKHVKSIRAVTRPIEIPADTQEIQQQSQICTSTTTHHTHAHQPNENKDVIKINNEKNTKKLKKNLNLNLTKKSTMKSTTKCKKNNNEKHLHMIHLHNHQSSPYHVSDHKAAITVGVIMGVFLICWVPFFCINIVAAFCKTCIPDITFKILTWLGYSNSAFNPIIYSIFNTEFREAFKRILTTHYPDWCHCCNNQDIITSKNNKNNSHSSHHCYHRNNSSSYKRRHSSIDHSFNDNYSNITIKNNSSSERIITAASCTADFDYGTTATNTSGTNGGGTRALIVTSTTIGSPVNGNSSNNGGMSGTNVTTAATSTHLPHQSSGFSSGTGIKRLNNRTNSVNYSTNTNIKNTIKHNSIDSSLQQYCRTNSKTNDEQISSI